MKLKRFLTETFEFEDSDFTFTVRGMTKEEWYEFLNMTGKAEKIESDEERVMEHQRIHDWVISQCVTPREAVEFIDKSQIHVRNIVFRKIMELSEVTPGEAKNLES